MYRWRGDTARIVVQRHFYEGGFILEIRTDWDINVTADMLIKRMGGSRKGQKMLGECLEVIDLGKKLLEPCTIYDIFSVKGIQGENVELENGLSFKSEHLAKLLHGTDRIVVMARTIGPVLEEKVRYLSEQGNFLTSYLLDVYANAAVVLLGKMMYRQIREQYSSCGATVQMEPGQLDWNIQEQTIVYKLVSFEKIGVTLADSFLMIPVKSATAVFGIGDPVKVQKGFPSCTYCSKKNKCTYREEVERINREELGVEV